MANILYGVNGEGSGHSTRANEVISHLQRQGHNLHIVSFDRGLGNLSKDFAVTEIYGLRLAYVNNQVRYRRTLARNLITAPQAVRSLARLSELTEAENIQLVITDFEPLSWHAARRASVPVISIDNQHCLTNTQVSVPPKYRRDAAIAKLVIRMMVPRANAYLVTSFFAPRVNRLRTFVFPPILREEVWRASPSNGEHVLVYVTAPAPELMEMLSSIRCRFVAYGFGRDGHQGSILYKKPAKMDF
jgi:uncharacterized protein (TIGR00661 family)